MDSTNDNIASRIGLRVTAFSDQGARKYMEDFFSIAYQKTPDETDLEYAYFGMYDGHGGESASSFAKNHLMNYIVNQKLFWSENDSDVLQAIKSGFLECHMSMWKELDKWPLTTHGLPSTAGTTASVAFIRRGKLFIGHVGDSGIVLGLKNNKGVKWIGKQLTIDHKPESPEEKARIESVGGLVKEKSGVPRVVWYRPKQTCRRPITRNTHIEPIPFLAVARSLGDLWSYNSERNAFVVSPEPDVSTQVIDIENYKCLIFASDGLWNMMDAKTAVEKVFDVETHNEKMMMSSAAAVKWKNPSRSLVEHAMYLWKKSNMRADNTSVVCVMLDPPEKRNQYKLNRNAAKMVNQCVMDPQDLEDQTIVDYSINRQFNLEHFTQQDVYSSSSFQRHNASFDLLADMKKAEQAQQYYDHTPGNAYSYNYEYPSNYDNSNPQYSGSQHYNHHQQSTEHYSSGYESYEQQQDNYQMPAPIYNQNDPAVMYQSSTSENNFTKACCPNNYVLTNLKTSHNPEVQHSYVQHQEYYESLNERPFPPLHYRFRYVRNPYQMERFDYMPFTDEQLAAFETENFITEKPISGELSDTDIGSFSDLDETSKASTSNDVKTCTEQTTSQDVVEQTTVDDSIQIHEISSSSFTNDKIHGDDDGSKPGKNNNKENSDDLLKKKKSRRTRKRKFYETRQYDRSLRSSATSVGIQKVIKKDKTQRRNVRNVRKAVKVIIEKKPVVEIVKKLEPLTEYTCGPSKAAKNKENTPEQKEIQPITRVLRNSHVPKPELATMKVNITLAPVSRSLCTSNNVMESIGKRLTRKRTSTMQENADKGKVRKIK